MDDFKQKQVREIVMGFKQSGVTVDFCYNDDIAEQVKKELKGLNVNHWVSKGIHVFYIMPQQCE